MPPNPYDEHLDKNPANYQPLTPLSSWSARRWSIPNHTAIIHGNAALHATRSSTRAAARLASALAARGIGLGDTVSVMLRQHPADARGALRRADDRRRAARASTRGSMRRSSPSSSIMPKSKVLITDREFAPVIEGGAGAGQGQAARSSTTTTRSSRRAGEQLSADRLRGVRRQRAIRISPGACRPTSGMRSRSTTRPARPAIPRASSITIAARR